MAPEQGAALDAVVLDTTGARTRGQPEEVVAITTANGVAVDELLCLADNTQPQREAGPRSFSKIRLLRRVDSAPGFTAGSGAGGARAEPPGRRLPVGRALAVATGA